MKCSIMQPTYFPWAGYFNLISQCDKFIFLNDAQFVKSSWHSSNVIIVKGLKYKLTVPTKKSPLDTTIANKLCDNSQDWQKKHSKIILQSYSNYPYINDLKDLLFFFEALNFKSLAEYNIEIIKYISKKLNIETIFYNSDIFNFRNKRTAKVISILNKVNATIYLSPEGSENYLLEDKFSKLTDVKLEFNKYKSIDYHQKRQKYFIKNLSIIDVIGNLGWIKSEKYVKQNLYEQ
ncbi:WbqC family protein [Candidatus Pelagibacter sp.]|nr:WbqC family protein [Candidatus Pelagibacter sp.]